MSVKCNIACANNYNGGNTPSNVVFSVCVQNKEYVSVQSCWGI